MADYTYDAFGNNTGFMEDEEERKKCEKELGNTTVGKTEVINYADGSQTEKTTKEVPAPVNPAEQSFFSKLGSAVGEAVNRVPENFSRNVDRFQQRLTNAPSNFMSNVQAAPANLANNVSQGAQQPTKPVAPANDMAAYTAQQESGNNPNIGYHFQPDETGQRKSTAFGTYGLTAPAYTDVQRANPQFANRPITSLTPQEQTQAYNTYTQLNGQQLQRLGVDPTQGNVQLAHLLGANGAARFLKTGEVSPEAAAANGGVERLTQIAQGRLQGGNAPSSGAVPQPRPMARPDNGVAVATGQGVQGTQSTVGPMSPMDAQLQMQAQDIESGLSQQPQVDTTPNSFDEFGTPVYSEEAANLQKFTNDFQTNQDNVDELMKLGTNTSAPESVRQRAKDRALELYQQQRTEQKAKEDLPKLTPKQVGDVAQGKNKTSVGDWMQYLLFRHLGLNDLANEKGEKLGIGHAWENSTITDEKGNERSVELLRSKSGKTLSGKFTGKDGAELSQEQLEQAAGGILGKGVHVSKVENVINPATGERIQEQTLSNGKMRYRMSGKAYAGDTSQFQNANAWESDQDRKSGAANTYLNRNFPAGATDQQKYTAYTQAGVHPRYIESLMGLPEGTLTKSKQPAPQPSTNTGTADVGVAPTAQKEDIFAPVVQRPGESTKDFESRKDKVEAKLKPLIKSVAEPFINKSAGIEQTLANIRLGIEALDSGDHNIGPMIAGRESSVLPGVQQALGGLVGTKASENTKLINSFMSEAGLKNIKDTMGPSISNFDVQTKLKQMPAGERSNPQAVRDFLLREYNSIYTQALRAKDITERLNMIEPGTVNLGPPASELVKKPKEKEQSNKVDTNNPLLK